MNIARYSLMVDSGNRDEPPIRRFATYDDAVAGMETLDDYYRKFAWIYEITDEGHLVVIVKDGKVVAG